MENPDSWLPLIRELGVCGALFVLLLALVYKLHTDNMRRMDELLRIHREEKD
jgi:hypothetical protein